MSRWAVYSLATIMDAVLSGLMFVCAERTVKLTGSSAASGGMLAMWAGLYSLASVGVGRITTRRNVGGMLLGSCVGVGLLCLAYLHWQGLAAMFAITGLIGVATAFFFTPFQVFMKLVDDGQNKELSRSCGLYVASWSLGYALGPFMAAFLWEWAGWQACHWCNAGLAAVTVVGVFLVKHHADAKPKERADDLRVDAGRLSGGNGHEPNDVLVTARRGENGLVVGKGGWSGAPVGEGRRDGLLAGKNGRHARLGEAGLLTDRRQVSRLPDLVWMAWVFSGIGCMLTSTIRSHFPAAGEHFGVSTFNQGVTLGLLSAAQGLVGFLLGWGRTWMYRPWPIIGFGLFGALGLLLFAVGHTTGLFWPAAVCMGVYSGSFYVYFVYHALVHPTRGARYVSINEAVVGVVGVVGPYMGGILADRAGMAVPFAVGAMLVLAGITVQAWLHHVHNGRGAGGGVNPSLQPAGGYDTAHERDQNQTRVNCSV